MSRYGGMKLKYRSLMAHINTPVSIRTIVQLETEQHKILKF